MEYSLGVTMNLDSHRHSSGASGVRTDTSPDKARAVFNCLSKLVLGKKIYARNNPTLLKFAEEFRAALDAFFESEDVLVVSIDKSEIRWNEHTVYSNDKRDESIAFILYKDGIGELSIANTVTPEEIDKFVDLVKDAVRAGWQDEDIVTLLWKTDLEHITYRVLDEYLVGEFGEGRRGDKESELATLETEDHPDAPSFAEKGRVYVGGGEQVEPVDSYLKRLAGSGGKNTAEERETHFQDMMPSFFTVSSDELRVFKDKLFEKRKNDNLVDFVADYLDFTLIQDNPSAQRDVTNIVERLTECLIAELRGPVLAALLSQLRKFAARNDLPPNVREFVSGIESKLVDPSVLLSIGETAGGSEEETEAAFSFFETVGPRAVPTIRKVMEDNSDPRIHRRSREALVKVAGSGLSEVIAGLNIDKPQVAQDVIALCRAARFAEVPPVIKELIYYPDDRVRREAIHFLAGFGTREALELLVRLLDDADKGVRLLALAVVSGVDAPVVKERVIEIAFGKEFAEREFDEQVEIFRALGRIAGEAAVPRLRQSVGKRTFLGIGKRHKQENKLLAIEALEQIDKPVAKKMLGDLANDSDDEVRTRACAALGGENGGGAAAEARRPPDDRNVTKND
jgi:HEAT repeat protein